MIGVPAHVARGRRRRLAAAGVSAAALGCWLAASFVSAASAQGASPAGSLPPPLVVDAAGADSLGALVLPYSPAIFDALVSVSRSFVAVTYVSRHFDPVTRNFVVSGLRLERPGFHAAVDTIRIGVSTSVYEGIVVDTRELPLEPPLRDALRRLDSETVRGSLVTSLAGDAASASYDLGLTANFEKIGRLTLAAKVDGFHVLVPLGDVPTEFAGDEAPLDAPQPDRMPVILGTLAGATLSFDDQGLTPVLFAIVGEQQNVPADQLRGAVSAMMTPMVASLFDGLPGGASPKLKAQAAEWSATLQGFIAKPGHIEVRLQPQTPFPLDRLKEGMAVDEALIARLNPSLSGTAAATAFVDPETNTVIGRNDLSLAERLVEGRGVPQDVERGVALALADVAAGKPEAAAVAVRGIVADPDRAVSAENAPSSYVLMLLAKVGGEPVPEGALAVVRAKLTADALATAENQALKDWRGGADGEAQRTAENKAAGARDWAGLRRLAYDYYEGQRVPRNVTRAFTLAEVAAAGGDGIAASLRDDLTRAERDGRLVFPIETGRQAAVRLWSKIVTASAASQVTPAP